MKGSVLGMLTICAVLAGAFHAYYDHQSKLAMLNETPKESDTKVDNKDTKTDPKPDPNFEPAEYKAALNDIDAGNLDKAWKALTSIAVPSKRSMLAQKIRLSLNKIRLFQELTEIVAPHQFNDGVDLYLLVLPNGETVMARIRGGVSEPRLKIAVRDGRRLEMKKSRLKVIKALSKTRFEELIKQEFQHRLDKLGNDPRPVSLFRTVIAFCLEFGLKSEAFKQLKIALKQPAGGVLIDLFCEGDLAALHRAHADMAGMSEIAMYEEEEPVFDEPETTPAPETNTDSPNNPPAKPKPARKKRANPLLSDPMWNNCDKLYREGLKIYRRSFGGSGDSEQAVIASAKAKFQKAQELVYKLDEKYPNDQMVQRRGQDLQQLIYDCVKREKL